MSGEGAIIPIVSKPGIQRDGTMFDSDMYVDGEWVRFVKGKPRKIGGYRLMSQDYAGPIRQLLVDARGDTLGIFAGSPSAFQLGYFTESGFGSAPIDRTPASLVASVSNMWQIDSMFDPTGGGNPIVVAHAAQNLANIKSQTNAEIYLGDITAVTPLTLIADAPLVSGGISVLFPYLFAYGNNGYVAWSDAADPSTWATSATPGDAGFANITNTKIIRGLPFQGGVGNSPGGLFWSLDKLYRADFVGGTDVFSFDFQGETSLIGSDAAVEYNGLYYWPDFNGRFCVYNGTIRDIENTTNQDFFFNNLNQLWRQKVIGFKIPRYGEVGWMFPKGDAVEPNHAIIHNTRENTWYDTPLPEGGRTATYPPAVFHYPIWAGFPSPGESTYDLWMHEFGVDKLRAATTSAIKSFFESAMFGMPSEGWLQNAWSGKDDNTLVFRLEPDFTQAGEMRFNIISRRTPKSPDVNLATYTFSDNTEYKDLAQYDGRIIRARFESNVQGGDYITGNPLLHVKVGGGRT